MRNRLTLFFWMQSGSGKELPPTLFIPLQHPRIGSVFRQPARVWNEVKARLLGID